ncbi:MAG: DMT family transporter [Ruminococcaceae bacterium]|nr:DMT family transporter [Oscillospiraceae bacterium]
MKTKFKKAIFFAFLAAALYALNSPFSKLLLNEVSPTMMAAFLYLGAGTGMLILGLVKRLSGKEKAEKPLTKKELPFIVGMVLLDIAAPIFLMLGLKNTTAANASLLNNFEIVATSLIALVVFKELISKKLWLAIILVTLSSIILSFEDISSLSFSFGSMFVLLACICWGFENNCTRMLSSKNPLEIVVIKGFGSGIGSLILAFAVGERLPQALYILSALVLGFVAYGLSIYFYIYAQRDLGAAKTSTYYAVAPFIGAGFSMLIFWQLPSVTYFVALAIMALGTYLSVSQD